MAEPTLAIGDPAPAFYARTDAGETISLDDFKGRKVVLFFYPKDDTPGCTKQACGFRDRFAEIEKRGAVVLGVSPDGEASHARFKKKYKLPFPLVVDENHAIAERYGVWGEKSMYGKKYMGIVRSHFVVDEEGRLADIRYQVDAALSPELALEHLK